LAEVTEDRGELPDEVDGFLRRLFTPGLDGEAQRDGLADNTGRGTGKKALKLHIQGFKVHYRARLKAVQAAARAAEPQQDVCCRLLHVYASSRGSHV
jgi:hypothetical protein